MSVCVPIEPDISENGGIRLKRVEGDDGVLRRSTVSLRAAKRIAGITLYVLPVIGDD